MRKLSIIILQHNTPEDVSKNLAAIKAAWLPENTEVIVVNNGGHDANGKISPQSYQGLNVKFFDTPNEGFPKGNNYGLKQTEAQFYAFVNPDIVVEPDTFKVLLDYLESNQHVGIVSPKLVYPSGIIQDNYRTFPRFIDLIIKRTPFLRRLFPSRMRSYLMWDKDTNVNEAIDWVTGAFIVVRKECMDKIGKHDDDYFLFMSDVVICLKAWENDYEVHYVADAQALHDDDRVSAGGFKDLFRKKTMRIHVKDAFKYFRKYLFTMLPRKAPSVSRLKQKERLMHARRLSQKSMLTHTSKKLQRHNPVVTVYEGNINAHRNYKQPIVFFNTGVVGIVRNEAGDFGLLRIWRHTPLQMNKRNTFPVFPDVGDLGVWSWECPRGGVEKSDAIPLDGLKRELYEEIGLKEEHIISTKKLGRTVANTAIDVYSHYCYEITIKNDFQFESHDPMETISEFRFFSKEELSDLIHKKELICGLTQAVLAQALIS